MMKSSSLDIPMPPVTTTENGEIRKIGVELEMIGIDIETLSRIVADRVSGTVETLSRYEHIVHGDPSGDWKIELDFAYLKKKGRETGPSEKPRKDMDQLAEELLRVGSEQIVPLEVVSPPIPLDRLVEVESLIERLREAGAKGTEDGLLYAFGMHFNPEVPATDTTTLTRYLKAFLCLFDWLKKRAHVNLTRRLTTYIDPFPIDYVRWVVDPAYRPEMRDLIDDYLKANPTRNRALDLLPLFALLDEPRVRQVIKDPRIQARPTFHYRLPNCEIDREGWGVRLAWKDWLEVERLAFEPDRLDELCRLYVRFLDKPLDRLFKNWAEQVENWLHSHPGDR
ncbi:MAG: amidoligase family protein [Methylothermaceae bacterium]|nr:amidoligase family protein [Methylothermaceae bacterium]